ncbi:MAG: DUF5682 family protein [Bacillota bacterium]
MEGLLHSTQMAEINSLYEKAYNLKSNLVFFPVRHHSPACSFHLGKVISEYSPEVILIEGPCNSGGVLRYIEHEESLAPLCIYYSYQDKKGVLGEKDGKYVCYYPFLDYSPELVAIREARSRGIRYSFIDLSYHDILANSSEGKGFKSKEGKVSYNDDYLLFRSTFIGRLCDSQGCRNFSELWEKLYEIDGISQETDIFVKNILAFCYFSRVDYTEEMLEADGCTAREKFMASNIKKALKEYARVLVVTGGFHTWGLLKLIEENGKGKVRTIDASSAACYAMAYSFEESDQLSGYASGMPHPAFYQEVWEGIVKGDDKPYESAILGFIIQCAKALRKNEGISTADEIEAFNMVKGLRILREKEQPGVFELMDGVRASFTKGEFNYYDKAHFDVLLRLLTGERTGKLCSDAEVPPIVKDFREKVIHFKLKTSTTVEQEQALDIYKSAKHREQSEFFHIMRFLNTNFCVLTKGPDFTARKNTNLIREIWKYKWSTAVESSLIEVSVYGGTLKEAASGILSQKFGEAGEHSGEISLLIVNAIMMGIIEILDEILPKVSQIIGDDGNFYSVADCTYNLGFIYSSGRMLGISQHEPLKDLVKQSYNKAVYLIPGLYSTGREDEDQIVSKLKDIFYISSREEFQVDREVLGEALMDVIGRSNCNSCIEGACTGLLLGLERIERDTVMKRAEGYLFGTGDKFLESVHFLKGLFSTARDIVYHDESFIKGIDHCIKNLDREDFLRLIPELRLSFSFFTPGEICDIAKRVSALYGVSEEKIVKADSVSELEIGLGVKLNKTGVNALKKWGLLNDE